MASTGNKRASFNDDRLMDKVSDSSVGGNQVLVNVEVHREQDDNSDSDVGNYFWENFFHRNLFWLTKSMLRSHNTSYCLIEVVTKAGLTLRQERDWEMF
jgi:hypothetical protein